MKKLLFLLFLCYLNPLFPQEKLAPENEITYGNRNHTNRDFLTQTLKDSAGNIYLLGSTENDFTFNDAKIIKLDKNLNVLWEKEKSFDLGISYDAILAGHVDSNNDLIVIFRTGYTSQKQTFITTKYDKNGTILWEYPLSDLTNPVDFNRHSFHSYLDDANNLSLVYQPVVQNSYEFIFTILSPSGQLINEFSTSEPFTADDGYSRRFKIINNNGVYNSISVEDIDSAPHQKFMLHKFTASSLESYDLGLDSEATNYFNTPFAETWSVIKKDNNNNLVLLAPSYNRHKDYGILNVNPDGTVKYIVYPDETDDKYPLGFDFDDQNNLIIVSNNRTSESSEDLEITLQKYDQNGNLFFQESAPYTGAVAKITASEILILTDQNKIVSFDYNLNSGNEVQLSPVNTLNFEINELLIIDSNYFLAGYTEDINYSTSVLISEIDMLIKKTDHSKELNSYRFSGKGTSKIFKKEEVVARDTAFAFAVVEKIGPDNFSPSGSKAPQQQRFVTINKEDLSILEDKIVPLNEVLLTTIYPKNLVTTFTANNGDVYDYVISPDTTNVTLHKNNNIQWSRNLDLYIDPNGEFDMNDNEVILDWKVNKKGDFYLSTYVYGLKEFTLHKFSIENTYNSLEFYEIIVAFEPLTNHWLFTMNQSGNITIYSDRLTVINQTMAPYANVYQSAFYLKEKNNQVLFHKHSQQNIVKFNQFGEIQPSYFEIDTPLDYGSNAQVEYDNNYLVVLEQMGSSIYLFPEYSWNRAVIKKYNLDQTSTFDEISFNDDDADGVTNNIDECRNTPIGELSNSYGCSSSQTLSTTDYLLNSDQVSIFPIPSSGIVNFDINDAAFNLKRIEVYDNIGRKVLLIDDINVIRNQKFDLKNSKAGIYMVRFYFTNNQYLNKKVIKVH